MLIVKPFLFEHVQFSPLINFSYDTYKRGLWTRGLWVNCCGASPVAISVDTGPVAFCKAQWYILAIVAKGLILIILY